MKNNLCKDSSQLFTRLTQNNVVVNHVELVPLHHQVQPRSQQVCTQQEKVRRLLCSKRNHHQNKKATNRMGEDIGKQRL